jgi:hypothetical protein
VTLAPTNLRDLERAIVTGLAELVPTLDPTARWSESSEKRTGGGSMRYRLYHLEWGDGEQVIGGATGNLDYEWETELFIVAHYGALPNTEIGEIVDRDHGDINRYFGDRLETIHGLTNWTMDGHGQRTPDEPQYEHRFRVAHLRR